MIEYHENACFWWNIFVQQVFDKCEVTFKFIFLSLYLQPQGSHNSVFDSSPIFGQYQEKEHCKEESKRKLVIQCCPWVFLRLPFITPSMLKLFL